MLGIGGQDNTKVIYPKYISYKKKSFGLIENGFLAEKLEGQVILK